MVKERRTENEEKVKTRQWSSDNQDPLTGGDQALALTQFSYRYLYVGTKIPGRPLCFIP